MDGPVALSVRGVDKSYKRRQVLTNVSFDVRRGEALAIVGENVAGKTTLLRICAGVLGADRGEIARIPVVAYCPQESGLIEHLTAAEHVRYVGAGLGLDPERAAARGAGANQRLAVEVAGRHDVTAESLVRGPAPGVERGQ